MDQIIATIYKTCNVNSSSPTIKSGLLLINLDTALAVFDKTVRPGYKRGYVLHENLTSVLSLLDAETEVCINGLLGFCYPPDCVYCSSIKPDHSNWNVWIQQTQLLIRNKSCDVAGPLAYYLVPIMAVSEVARLEAEGQYKLLYQDDLDRLERSDLRIHTGSDLRIHTGSDPRTHTGPLPVSTTECHRGNICNVPFCPYAHPPGPRYCRHGKSCHSSRCPYKH